MKRGIDISYYQGEVNFEKLAKSVDFVILREGYRKTVDSKFVEYVSGLKKNKVNIHGVYHFIYAYNNVSAREEALSAIANVQKVGLPKTTPIWADMEYDTIKKAKALGINLGRNEINLFTQTFCDTIREFGYPTGIYCNVDWYRNKYFPETLAKYPVWLADLDGEPDFDCLMQQYTFSGKVDGVNTDVDMDYCFCLDCENTTEKEKQNIYSRQEIVSLAKSWLGKNTADGTHRTIIDIYNGKTPLPRSYKVKYTDAWCATTISALAIALGYEDIIPIECGCPQMIDLAKEMGIWIENDAHVPQAGDIVLYDWQDSSDYKSSDNLGNPDHVGIVESVEKNGNFVVIEGNYNDSVSRRKMEVNGRFIRGFIVPKYSDDLAIGEEHKLPSASQCAEISANLVRDAQTHLNNFVGTTLALDGKVGLKTLTAMRMAVQTGLNLDFNAGLEVDGVIGAKSKSALKKVALKRKAKGYLVTALEICLMARGYDVGGVECPGIFGQGLEKAVKQFQSDNGLKVDGEAGFQTFTKLLQ